MSGKLKLIGNAANRLPILWQSLNENDYWLLSVLVNN